MVGIVASAFRFLDDEEFAKLDSRNRAGYLVRAHEELTARQRILRDQMRKTVAVDTESTIPVPPLPSEDAGKASEQ